MGNFGNKCEFLISCFHAFWGELQGKIRVILQDPAGNHQRFEENPARLPFLEIICLVPETLQHSSRHYGLILQL